MAVTRVAYEADGWGVGELWLEGDVVVWHELPNPATGLQLGCNPVADLRDQPVGTADASVCFARNGRST